MYSSRITTVGFHLAGGEEVELNSAVQVKHRDLYRNNIPYPEGAYDAHMGTTSHEYRCQTCFNTKKACLGHAGHIELNYPVWNPNAVKESSRWIKMICFKCGGVVIPAEQYESLPRGKRLEDASKTARTGMRICAHCAEPHPIIRKDKVEPLRFYADYFDDDKHLKEHRTLYPHMIMDILSRVTDETIVALGRPLTSPPRNFLMMSIPVPSVVIRPDVKKMGSGRSANDDLTLAIQNIIKKSAQIPTVLPEKIPDKLERVIYELNNAYYDMIKASGEGAMNSIAQRLKGKPGRFRKNLQGKRCRNMARSTIINNIGLKIDEVAIPLSFARTLQCKEVVQEYNRHRLLEYVQNGSARYPGASRIKKKSTGRSYNAEFFRDIELENGDVIYRDYVDGDPIDFNRQPSLKVSNISTNRVVVIKNASDKTLGMNVISCVLYGADFDGDQMNLAACAGIGTRNEIAELSSVPNWFISHTSAAPQLGQVDDSVIGLAELTRSDIRYDKYHAMLLFQNTSVAPSLRDISAQNPLTGRDAISMLLADTPINFSRVPEWYKQSMAPFIDYDPTEIRVVIDQGKMLSGILDKKSIGKNSKGGVYHIIAKEYGAEAALTCMYDMQQMAISHTAIAGYTIGIDDLMVPADIKVQIDQIASDIINKSRLITEDLYNGEIIPPIGKTVEEFYEQRQINTLSIFDDFTEPILRAINPRTNNLFKLIAFGSKGKLNDMFNMMSAIGQKTLNGERPRQTFGYKRTLVYFPRFDASPESRGYITNSYLSGMTTPEYIFNAMAARFDLISKVLSTSITGEQMRKSIKNLESLITNNFRRSLKGRNVVQLVYGEDFIDPRHLERVKFPTMLISDAEFAAKYQHADFPEFFEAMTADRVKYRAIYTKMERASLREMITDECNMPVNIDRIIGNVVREYADVPGKVGKLSKSAKAGETNANEPKDLATMVSMVTDMCAAIPYVLINEIQERRKMPIPEYISSACWLLTVCLRSYLHPHALVARGVTPTTLKIIIDRIRLKYAQALIEPGTAVGIIAAQAFSEPFTQYMLDAHHRSASGGTSRSGITNVKEIHGAKAVDQLISPSMLIPIVPMLAGDRARVQEIANNIEMMKLARFVTSWHIYFEKYGVPVHPTTIHETAWINEFATANPLLTPPGDLIRWCIRFRLNKTTLILKNMSIELIASRLREVYPELYVIYTQENNTNSASNVILRVYMRNSMFKGAINTADVRVVVEACLSTIIRGVDRILSTNVVKMIRSQVNPDGSITMNDNVFGITTDGTNMRGVLLNKHVDKYYVQTDAIQEMSSMLGIEAARRAIIAGLDGLAISDIDNRHYMMYADEMTYTGKVTSIESSGIKTRENSNVLLRSGYSSPMATLEEAAINGMIDQVVGITAPLVVGSVPEIGSIYNSFYVNEEFVRENVINPDDLIAEIL